VTEERRTSPDGALTLVVTIDDHAHAHDHSHDDDHDRDRDHVSVRFEGYPWHVHGGELCDAGYSDARDPIEAARAFAAEVVADRVIVVLQRVDGETHDVWVTDNPERELAYDVEGDLEFRRWTRAL
jgi:hypothetical protein